MPKHPGVINPRDFARDLGRGALGEDIVVKFFLREYSVIARNVSDHNPDYDLLIDALAAEVAQQEKIDPEKLLQKFFRGLGFPKHKVLSVEVKLDEAAARYRNFFIEIFFDVERGVPGGFFKCKADLMAWVVPVRSAGGKFKIYLFNRASLLAWVFKYLLEHPGAVPFKTPGISPNARGVAIPIAIAEKSPACLGVFDYDI